MIEDSNGVSLKVGGRVKTMSGRVGYVVSVFPKTGMVRVTFSDGLTKKVFANTLIRF